MDIIKRYNNPKKIGPIYKKDLSRILDGHHPTIKVEKIHVGLIMLSNGFHLKCIDSYYHIPNKKRLKSKECFYVKQAFGANNILLFDCKECHKFCLENKNIKMK